MERRKLLKLGAAGIGAALLNACTSPWSRRDRERPQVERESEREVLRKRLLKEFENLRTRAQGVIDNFSTLVPDDVLALIQNHDETGQGEVFIQAWETRARTALDSQLTFRGDELELVSQDEYQTFSAEGKPVTLRMAKTVPQELFVASAITRDTTLKQRCLEAIQVYCEWNARNAFTQLDENRVLLHEWRMKQEIEKQTNDGMVYRLDERNRKRVLDSRNQKITALKALGTDVDRIAADNLERNINFIDRAYPMNQWGTFHNFLMSLSCVWDLLDASERDEYRKQVLGFVRFWQSKRQEFAGLLARYYSNAGERISDQAAPDDTIARPVGFASDCAVLLRKMGERDASFEFQTFARELMESSDEAFYRKKQRVSAGRANIQRLIELGKGKNVKAIRKSVLENATWDLPGDGVRVAAARVSLVRSIVELGERQGEARFIEKLIERAVHELYVFMNMASQRSSVLFWQDEGKDEPVEPQDARYRVDREAIIGTSGYFKKSNRSGSNMVPVRYLIPNGHESGNGEWPIVFASVWELGAEPLWSVLRGRLRNPTGIRLLLNRFKKDSERFLSRSLDSMVKLNNDPNFTDRDEKTRVGQLAGSLRQCAIAFGASVHGRGINPNLRLNPNLQNLTVE